MKKNQYPASGEYAKLFDKFHPQKVEINEATVDDTIHFGMHLKRSEPEIAEAMDIYKALGMTLTMDWMNSQLTLHKRETNDYLLNMRPMHTSTLYKTQHPVK